MSEEQGFDPKEDLKSVAEAFDEITIPKFKNWDLNSFYDYEHQIFDYEKLEELSKAITSARIALFEINEKINKCERLAKKTKLNYERTHRRAYLSSNQKTESLRKAYADIQSEDLENDKIVYEQLLAEFIRASNTVRIELQTLQSIGNNIRQQMKMD